MAKKIVRKEIEKSDWLQLTMNKITIYVVENKKKIYLLSGIFTLIVMISVSWYFYRMNYENNAQKLFAKAHIAGMQSSMQGINPDQNILKLYQDVVTQYPGSKASMMSYYQMGNIYYITGDIDASIKAYTEFIKGAPENSDLTVLTYNGLGYCYEAKRDLKNALFFYEKASSSQASGSFEGITLRNIARIYEEMKDKTKAVEYYQKALNKTTDTSMQHFLIRKISSIN